MMPSSNSWKRVPLRWPVPLAVLAMWTAVAALTAGQTYVALAARGHGPDYARLFLLHLVPWYLWAAATPLLYALARRFPFDGERWRSSLLLHVPASALLGAAMLAGQLAFNAWLEGIPLGSARAAQGFLAMVAFSLHQEVLVYWLVVAGAAAYIHYRGYQASRERFNELLARAEALEAELESQRAAANGQRETGDGGNGYLQRLVIRDAGRVAYLPVAEIDWIEAADYYAEVHAAERLYLLRESLASLEQKLDPLRFARVHRSTIVNLSRVREMRQFRRGEHEVVLRDGTAFRLSRSRRAQLEAALAQGTSPSA